MSALWADSVADFSAGIARLLICDECPSVAVELAFTAVILPPETVIATVTLPYRSVAVWPAKVPSLRLEELDELAEVDEADEVLVDVDVDVEVPEVVEVPLFAVDELAVASVVVVPVVGVVVTPSVWPLAVPTDQPRASTPTDASADAILALVLMVGVLRCGSLTSMSLLAKPVGFLCRLCRVVRTGGRYRVVQAPRGGHGPSGDACTTQRETARTDWCGPLH